MTDRLLHLDRVTKTFGPGRRRAEPVRAVVDVSVSVDAGETVAIVGESGSGKTTVARLALGLLAPDSGRIAILGTDQNTLTGRSGRRVRRLVQPVFQDPTASLNPRRSVLSTLAQAARSEGRRGTSRRQLEDLSLEVLHRVGLRPGADYLHRYPQELSGGQRQRLTVARALAARPRLVIADEPLSGADASIRGQLLNMLEEQQRELGLAYLLITHDISVARAFANRVIVMTRGAVVEEGDAAAVLTSPTHPYTRALIDAVPHIRRETQDEASVPARPRAGT